MKFCMINKSKLRDEHETIPIYSPYFYFIYLYTLSDRKYNLRAKCIANVDYTHAIFLWQIKQVQYLRANAKYI